MRRKRVLAMLDARIISPARDREARQKSHHKRDLIHHAFNPIQHIGNVDHRYRRIRRKQRALHRRHLLAVDMCAPVPGRRFVLQLSRGQNELHARAQVLAVGAIDRGHLQRPSPAAHLQLDRRTHAQMQSLGRAFANGNLRSVRTGPPLALRHLVALRRCIGPGQLSILQHPPRKMLLLQLL